MAGVEKSPIRIPSEWDRVLPGFSMWFNRFVRDVLSKGDIRNAQASGGIVITGDPVTVATVSTDGFGGASLFAQRHEQTPRAMDQVIGEMRTFIRPASAPTTNFADAQAILAHRIFGG